MAGQKRAKSEKFRTPECRCSYVNVFAPRADQDDPTKPAKYGVCLMFDKGTDITELKRAARAVGEVEFGPTFWEGAKARRYRWPFRDGDTNREGDAAFANTTFLNCTSKMKPQVFDERVQPITDPEQFGSGDYAKVLLNFFAYESKGNKGIGVGLIALQRSRRGEPLGGFDASGEFEADPDAPVAAGASMADEFDI